jgi:membrane protein
MSWLTRIPGLAHAHAAVTARVRSVWSGDRAPLRGFSALGSRLLRVGILVVRGLVAHRLGMLAAALTFFTVFSMIPMLVVALWALKALDHLPVITPELPGSAQIPTGNELLHAALGEILESVYRASEVTGLVGLGALLYVVTKMFSFTERALHTIAGSGQRTPRFSRMLGYVALMLMPLALLAIAGTLLALAQKPIGLQISRLVGAVPGLELVIGTAVGLGALWLAITIFYSSAVRARIPFRSAAVGGAAAAIALPVVFWAYMNFQIGVSQASALGSGFLAFPVFLLWAFSSWYTLLFCAEIAVAHNVDRVLVHGARTFHLDHAGERQASAAIMIRIARAARPGLGQGAAVAEDDLARELRLPPNLVGDLCLRLLARGLLVEERRGFSLARNPDDTALAEVIDAVERDPALDAVNDEAAGGFPPEARAALSSFTPPRAAEGERPTLGDLARTPRRPRR